MNKDPQSQQKAARNTGNPVKGNAAAGDAAAQKSTGAGTVRAHVESPKETAAAHNGNPGTAGDKEADENNEKE